MVPFGPKPVPEDRWFESKPLLGPTDHHARGRDDERGAGFRRVFRTLRAYGRAYIPAVVDSMVAGRPAERAGLHEG